MALKLVCDGDGGELTEATATRVGRLDPVQYCAACLKKWTAYERAEAAQRVKMVTAFEAWRRMELTKLKRGGLATLPDEWGLDDVTPTRRGRTGKGHAA